MDVRENYAFSWVPLDLSHYRFPRLFASAFPNILITANFQTRGPSFLAKLFASLVADSAVSFTQPRTAVDFRQYQRLALRRRASRDAETTWLYIGRDTVLPVLHHVTVGRRGGTVLAARYFA